jgi:beta-xylosidase
MRRLGVRHVRTGLSWADAFREGALDWFDEQMEALSEFEVTATFCFTPEHRGIERHHTSPPQAPQEFAAFCGEMTRRYAPTSSGQTHAPEGPAGGRAAQTAAPDAVTAKVTAN